MSKMKIQPKCSSDHLVDSNEKTATIGNSKNSSPYVHRSNVQSVLEPPEAVRLEAVENYAGDSLRAEVLEVVLYVHEAPKACAVCCSVY